MDSTSQPSSPEPDGLMAFLDDVLGLANWVDRLEGLIMSLRYGDYVRAREHGLLALLGEVGSSVLTTNTCRFALRRSGRYSLHEVEALLKRYGIPIFGRTHDAKALYFHVKKRQARWAEYILLHAGVELLNPPLDPRHDEYVARHAPGYMPTPWEQAKPQRVATPRASGGKITSFWQQLWRKLGDWL